MTDRVNILGTVCSVIKKDYNEDETFSRHNCCGYYDDCTNTIVICNMRTHPFTEDASDMVIAIEEDKTLRHEIVHAFMEESGLSDNAANFCGPWTRNEEMIDYFSIQGCKIYEAWKEADCLRIS